MPSGSAVGSIAGGLIGAAGSKEAARIQSGASDKQIEEDRRQFDLNREDLAPWRQVGTGAIFKLADLLGIKTGANVAPVAPRREDFTTTTPGQSFSNFVPKAFRDRQAGGTSTFDTAGFNKATEDYNRALQAFQNQTQDPSGELLQDFGLEDFEADPGYMFRLAEGNKALSRSGAGRVLDSGATMKDLLRFGQNTASDEFMNAYNRDAANKARKFNFLAGVSGSGQQAANTLVHSGTQLSNNIGNSIAARGNARAAGIVGGANAISGGINNAIQGYQFDRFLDEYRNAA